MVTDPLQAYMTSLVKIQSLELNIWLPGQLSTGQMLYGLMLPGQLNPGQMFTGI